jgi:hypothetical protein
MGTDGENRGERRDHPWYEAEELQRPLHAMRLKSSWRKQDRCARPIHINPSRHEEDRSRRDDTGRRAIRAFGQITRNVSPVYQAAVLPDRFGSSPIHVSRQRHRTEAQGAASALLLQSSDSGHFAQQGRMLVSGSRFIRLSARPELAGEEMLDLCAMHFDPSNYGETGLERGFFDIKGADVWNGGPQTTFLVFGYPTSLRNLIVDDVSGALEEIKVKMTAISASYLAKSNAQGVHAIELVRSGNYSSDGLSGGTVFHLGEDAKGLFCGFAGVVIRGSETSDVIHFMDERLIQQFFLHSLQAAS